MDYFPITVFLYGFLLLIAQQFGTECNFFFNWLINDTYFLTIYVDIKCCAISGRQLAQGASTHSAWATLAYRIPPPFTTQSPQRHGGFK